MTDLYNTLGVRKNATDATIKSAYRNKSKRAHPDAGGSKEAFEALRLARDILLDPVARAYYDATGKIKPTDLDQGRGPVIALVGMVLETAVHAAAQKNIDVKTEDVVEAMVALIEQRIEGIAQAGAGRALRRKVLMDMAGRFETREEGADNVLEAVVTGSLSSLDQEQRLNEEQKTLHKAALALIKTHKFRKDVKKQMAMQQVYMSVGSTTGAATGGW